MPSTESGPGFPETVTIQHLCEALASIQIWIEAVTATLSKLPADLEIPVDRDQAAVKKPRCPVPIVDQGECLKVLIQPTPCPPIPEPPVPPGDMS